MIAENILTAALQKIIKDTLVLKQANRIEFPRPVSGREYLLYAHVPFCESLCPYCSFNRVVSDESSIRAYYDAMRREMRTVAGLGYNFHSMYIGGGTPTIIVDELCQTIDLARQLFDIREVSCETNPNHMIPRIVEPLAGRVQRMSVGVQSFDDDILRKVKRLHRFGSGEETLARLKESANSFPTVNVDLIFNFPGQTEQSLRRDVRLAVETGASQITFYPLMSSPSVESALRRSIGAVSHDLEKKYYQIIVEEMGGQYELTTPWNFSLKTSRMIDEYIVDYEEYVGIGSGSFSYLDGSLLVNNFSIPEYQHTINAGRSAISGQRSFNHYEQMRYRMMMDLFSLRLDKRLFQERFSQPIELGLPLEIAFLAASGGFARYNAREITLTPEGRYLMLVMMREFFAGINTIRDQARQQVAVCMVPALQVGD